MCAKKKGNQRPKKKNNGGGVGAALAPVVRSAIAQGLRMGGRALGTFAGGPVGGTFGENAGAWVSKLIGSGDYEVRSNTIYSKGHTGVPTFANASSRSVRIQHREYLGDITGSTAFASRAYSINPGASGTFPWLSAVAVNYQQYKIHGMVFCFNSTSADALNSVNTALGTVIMATQYNVNRDDFTSKLEMEGYEFSCATKPSNSLMHPIECAPGETPLEHMYIRSGAVPSGEDKRMYDWGTFQIATVGMQAAANIGELWVTYDVEFFKPRISPGGALPGLFSRINNGAYTNTDLFGSIQVTPVGNLGVTVASNGTGWGRLQFPSNLSTGRYFVHIYWRGNVTLLTLPNPSTSNMTVQSIFGLGTVTDGYAPATGQTSSRAEWAGYVTINGYDAAGSYLNFAPGTLPSSGLSCDILVISMPLSDNFI